MNLLNRLMNSMRTISQTDLEIVFILIPTSLYAKKQLKIIELKQK